MVSLDPAQPVCVIGSGAMGAGIAQVAAVAGHRTLLFDADQDRARKAVDDIHERLRRQAEKGRMTSAEADAAGERIQVLEALADLRGQGCGLVVEAIVENVGAKQDLFADLETFVDAGCILATNTSSLSVTGIGARLSAPGRFVGMHFFNPAPLMPLVEIVSGLATDPKVTELVRATAEAWGKTPVDVRSTPGFVVNRVARPFYAEAFRLYEERAADAVTIDAVLREAGGFKMGPFELTDLIGQDVNEIVTRTVWRSFSHDPRYLPSAAQRELVEAGWLGRKTGRGFYDYSAGVSRPVVIDAEPGPRPDRILVQGDMGQLSVLLERSGVPVEHLNGDGVVVLPSGGMLTTTDGSLATARAARLGRPVVLVDYLLDPTTATRVAVAASERAPAQLLGEVTGLLHAAGVQVSVVDDAPGLVVGRTVAMLVNSAVDALWQGVAGPADIDTAMRLGTNYPVGPLEWGDRWGAATVVEFLDNLAAAYGDGRYRVCPLLRRRALSGTSLLAPI